MGLIGLLIKDPLVFVIFLIVILYSVILHEIAHGFVAYIFGDNTARRLGRLSLNPLVHIDYVGTLALIFVGFGWAKPVPIDFRNLRNFRVGLICVSLAGCAANLFIAALALGILHMYAPVLSDIMKLMLVLVVRINIILGAFNLIPIPPLDGSKILMGLLPFKGQVLMARFEPYGIVVLMLLLLSGLLNPVINLFQNALLTLIVYIMKVLHHVVDYKGGVWKQKV